MHRWYIGFFLAFGCALLGVGVFLSFASFKSIATSSPDVFFSILFGVAVFSLTEALHVIRQRRAVAEARSKILSESLLSFQASQDAAPFESPTVRSDDAVELHNFLQSYVNDELRRRMCKSEVLAREVDVFSTVSLVERAIEAGIERLNEYLDHLVTEAGTYEKHEKITRLQVVFKDLDHARAELAALRSLLYGANPDESFTLKPSDKIGLHRTELEILDRSLTGSIARQLEAMAVLESTHAEKLGVIQPTLRTMSADLYNAQRCLMEMLSKTQRNRDFNAHIETLAEFVAMALWHALTVARALDDKASQALATGTATTQVTDPGEHEKVRRAGFTVAGVLEQPSPEQTLPATFGVMIRDLCTASQKLAIIAGDKDPEASASGESNGGPPLRGTPGPDSGQQQAPPKDSQ